MYFLLQIEKRIIKTHIGQAEDSNHSSSPDVMEVQKYRNVLTCPINHISSFAQQFLDWVMIQTPQQEYNEYHL